MALQIYKLNESDMTFEAISSGTFLTPILLQTAPGGIATVTELYLKNSEDDGKYYTDLVLKPVASPGGADIVDGTVTIQLISGDAQPTEERWGAAPVNSAAILQSPLAGGQIDTRLPEIGSANGVDLKYYPFWVRVKATKGTPIGSLYFNLKLDYEENLVA